MQCINQLKLFVMKLSVNTRLFNATAGRNMFVKNLFYFSLWMSPRIIPFYSSDYWKVMEFKLEGLKFSFSHNF